MGKFKFVQVGTVNPPTQAEDAIEEEIRRVFKRQIYLPLLKLLGQSKNLLRNATGNPVEEALGTGRITFNRGVFSGKFSAEISRELKKYGATWDSTTGTFRLQLREVPFELQQAIRASESQFKRQLGLLDKQLASIVPAQVAEAVRLTPFFDSALFTMQKTFRANVRGLGLVPELTAGERKKIASEWSENLELSIKTFTEDEILKLRERVKETTFKGNRYGSLVGEITSSYGVSQRKAEFLARQETRLLTSKFQEAQYLDADMPFYRWKCVTGSEAHPVRPRHKQLNDTIQRWDTPPVTTEPGDPERRNHPGGDFRCRCYAIGLRKVPT